ncbi:B12-binding domain-containing protein [Nonomuraea sp. NPDC050663]|uniref:B12-binding domain-containing protein n=1 Tax=Nonomuraea sp. NPDC050663 TaxID=3364370 RepID=UPI0037A5D023
MTHRTIAASGGVVPAWKERLWEAVLDCDEFTAVDLVDAVLDEGVDPESFLLDVVAPVQARVGAEWAANRLTVAQEHAATAINERVVAALALHPAARRTSRSAAPAGRVTVACIDGEWHALPARILAEVLRLRGWQVDFLGAQVPTHHLIAHIHRTAPQVVGLSSSIPTRLPTAHAAVTACQATGTPVLVGGAAFGPGGRYAEILGADAWAPDARAAAELIPTIAPRSPAPQQAAIDDLPHLADQEYTMVSRTAGTLVKSVMAGLEERFPAMASYTPKQRGHTAEDIAHIVTFLATALYVDEERLFTDFVDWTAGILTVRGVPAVSLVPTLELLTQELSDFPRARAMITAAHERLTAPPTDNAGPAHPHDHGKPA